MTTFEGRSFYDLFRSEIQLLQGEKPDVDPSIFKDRIVIVGASASGTYDVFTTPFGTPSPGAEIHANAIDALLRARTLEQFAMFPGGLVRDVRQRARHRACGRCRQSLDPGRRHDGRGRASSIWSSLQWFAGGSGRRSSCR